jgi:hypothetical protein
VPLRHHAHDPPSTLDPHSATTSVETHCQWHSHESTTLLPPTRFLISIFESLQTPFRSPLLEPLPAFSPRVHQAFSMCPLWLPSGICQHDSSIQHIAHAVINRTSCCPSSPRVAAPKVAVAYPSVFAAPFRIHHGSFRRLESFAKRSRLQLTACDR